MKKVYLTICIAISSFTITSAQTASAVVYSESGEKFIAYLNGEKKNDAPAANVKMTGLTSEFYKIRIDFEDASIPDVMENFGVQLGTEATYVVKRNKKGEMTCRFQSYSEGAVSSAPATSPAGVDSQTKNYAVVDDEPVAPVKSNTTTNNVSTEGSGVNSKVTVTETTTTTSKGGTPTGDRVNMNMNVGGVNMGVDINVEGMEVEESSSSTTVTTKTTTTSSSTGIQQGAVREQPVHEEVVVTGRCAAPMNASTFNTAKASIESKGFEESKMTTAKQIAKANCLYASQIKDIMGLFGFEESKLDFAKYAYDYCFDPNNYYQVNDAFGFESSIEELNTYLESK